MCVFVSVFVSQCVCCSCWAAELGEGERNTKLLVKNTFLVKTLSYVVFSNSEFKELSDNVLSSLI